MIQADGQNDGTAGQTAVRALGLGMLTACAAPLRYPTFKKYAGPPVTEVVVHKGERRLHLLSGNAVLKSYDIGLGNEPICPKHFGGDGKTPEGLYYPDRFNSRSSYHLSVGISYPTKGTKPMPPRWAGVRGGYHDPWLGTGWKQTSPRSRDWTAGCIVVTDEEIEEIYATLQPGTPIRICP